ncbi:prolactin-inducible protein [Erinaceus europaeus]|uniref:Prolactin-induced protein n=1 Tax=Erinaceus europaeus TaxID=9365 RepID=A0A1S2ZP77_ERIEU|nr:prolactin-inducible protein [Erinaceus europaeus]
MQPLQFLPWACRATLFLIFCLHLGPNNAQQDTRNPVIMDMEIQRELENQDEITLKGSLKTELKECMVAKVFLVSSYPMSGPFYYTYTTCLCEDSPKTFYWEFPVVRQVDIALVAKIISEENICTDAISVIPNKGNFTYIRRKLSPQ